MQRLHYNVSCLCCARTRNFAAFSHKNNIFSRFFSRRHSSSRMTKCLRSHNFVRIWNICRRFENSFTVNKVHILRASNLEQEEGECTLVWSPSFVHLKFDRRRDKHTPKWIYVETLLIFHQLYCRNFSIRNMYSYKIPRHLLENKYIINGKMELTKLSTLALSHASHTIMAGAWEFHAKTKSIWNNTK